MDLMMIVLILSFLGGGGGQAGESSVLWCSHLPPLLVVSRVLFPLQDCLVFGQFAQTDV